MWSFRPSQHVLYIRAAPRRLPGDHPIPAQCHSRWWVRHVQTSRQPKRFWCGTNLHRLSRTSALRPPLLHAPARFLAVVCDSGKPGLIKFHNPRTSFKLTLDFWATYILTSLALLHMWRCMPMLACSLGLQTERRYFLPSRSSWLSTKLPNKSKFEYNLGCELWVLFSVPRSSRLNNLWQQKTYKSTSKFFPGSTFTPLPSYPEDSWKLITADILRKSGNWGVKAPFQHATHVIRMSITCCEATLHGFICFMPLSLQMVIAQVTSRWCANVIDFLMIPASCWISHLPNDIDKNFHESSVRTLRTFIRQQWSFQCSRTFYAKARRTPPHCGFRILNMAFLSKAWFADSILLNIYVRYVAFIAFRGWTWGCFCFLWIEALIECWKIEQSGETIVLKVCMIASSHIHEEVNHKSQVESKVDHNTLFKAKNWYCLL